MKDKLTLLAVAVLAAVSTLTASAQYSPRYGANVLGVPAVLTGGTTNLATPQLIDTRYFQNGAFQSTVIASAPGATNIYTLLPSLDGVSYDTNASDSVTFTNALIVGSGVATNTVTSKFAVGSIGYYRLSSIVTTGTATNSVSYAQKISAP